MKYGTTSERRKETSKSNDGSLFIICCTSCSSKPVHMLIYALRAGMWCCCRCWWWWWAPAWQDVCFLDRAREAKSSKSCTPVQNHKRAREAIGLTARVMETAKPCRLRALGSAASGTEWRGFFGFLRKPAWNEPSWSFSCHSRPQSYFC